MYEIAAVNVFEGAEHVQGDPYRLRRRQCTALQALRQRLSLEELHGDVQGPRVLTDLVDRADSGMADRGCGTGLTPEALPRLLVRPETGYSACLRTREHSRSFTLVLWTG